MPRLSTLPALRRRLTDESGFTMIIALGVLLAATMLLAAMFVALDGDAHLSGSDLDAKRAYYSARSGIDAYLYQLNQNTSYWQSCTNDSSGGYKAVPGATTGEQYSYDPVPANGNSVCNSSNVVGTMIDAASGTFSLKFFGKAGTAPTHTRGIVASFRRRSPLDYLYYTVFEALDSSISGYNDCGVWYRQGRNSHCDINWFSGDAVNGPMYTQDQLLIGGGASPTFGRTSKDIIATQASNSICSAGCGSAVINGTQQLAQQVPEPSSNSALLTDAQTSGTVYNGTTTITLSGTTAAVTNCPTSSTCVNSNVNIASKPIIYVQNASGCSPPAYTPFGASYSNSGCAGDVYVSGTYSTSLTIAAANNIIVTGNITTSGSGNTLTGNAALGLIANQFVRVEHQVPTRPAATNGSCPSSNDTIDLNNLTIDAAILALQHSFIVDNYDCNYPQQTTAAMGNLTVNGSITQKFRGTVGEAYYNGGGTDHVTGYIKNYNYDDRLAYLQPPYLFDILTAGWQVSRETLCVPNGGTSSVSC